MGRTRGPAGVALLACLCLLFAARADAHKQHKYEEGAHVPLYSAKIGPFANPSVTYEFYTLPFCKPENGVKYKRLGLGEAVDANRMATTPYDLAFRVDREDEVLCETTLSEADILKFQKAVQDDYYFQMYYDDLPVWGFIGRVHKAIRRDGSHQARQFLFTHVDFDIKYNGHHVIEVNMVTDPVRTLDISDASGPMEARFTYSVHWAPTDTQHGKRLDRYRRFPLNPAHLEVHWFSIINSCVTVLLLTGFLATILARVLKADFVRYSREDGVEEEEAGWKYVHGDVFRFPRNKNLFCAFVGAGSQILCMAAFVFALALVGAFYPYNRGALTAALIVLYALTAGIAGFQAGSYYRQMGGEQWVRNILLTCGIFCGPLFLVFSVLNSVAWAQGSTAALPAGTIAIIVLLWLLVTAPLTVAGGIVGKNRRGTFAAPCRTNKYPREVPKLPWYRSALPQMALAGFLPFSAIYVELYYVFASVWGHKVYIIWSILAIVFLILIIVTAFITVALTYFQLAAEDHRWWWRSFLCGGSTALFVYAYSFHFFHARSGMGGFMQTCFYFGYNFVTCLAFFFMLGTVGWRATLTFVRHIYRSCRVD